MRDLDAPVALDADPIYVVAALARSRSDLLIVTDAQMNIVFASDANGDLFGRSAASAIGDNGIEFINPDDLSMFAAMLDAYGRGYSSDAPNYYRVRHEDGTWIRMEIGGGPLYRNGELEGWSFVLRRPLQAEVYASVVRQLFDDQPLEVTLRDVPNAFFALGIGKVCITLWPAGEDPCIIGDRLPGVLNATDRGPGTPFARAIAEGTHVVVHDLAELPDPLRTAAEAEGFGSLYVAPATEAAGRVAGLIVHWVNADMPKAEMLAARMEEASGLVQVALTARFQHDHLKRSAGSDPLTGLANRRTFDDRLHELSPSDRPALLSIDLDGFKEVNDALGHPVGDELLQVLAARFVAVAGPDALVARIGGDEFVVLVTGADAGSAQALASRLVAVGNEPVVLDGTAVSVGASIGVAVTDEAATADGSGDDWVAQLVRRADDALYAAKRDGRGQVAVA